MKRILGHTKVYNKHCYSVWKETSQKPFKVIAAKSPVVYIIDTTCFAEYILFYVITGKQFLRQIYCYSEVWLNRHVVAFFETSVLKEVCIFLYVLSPQ